MAANLLVSLLLLWQLSATKASFFEINYPDVMITAETNGNLTVEAGPQGGNIIMKPTGNGTVYIGQTDMLRLFEIVDSMPPIWQALSPHGTLGTFLGGTPINVTLKAMDPEGGALTFHKVSGALPPGVTLDKSSGKLMGMAPDVDATYEFGIRVTDSHGKYADQLFSIDTREKNQCTSSPCYHNGACSDEIDGFTCTCLAPYGGHRCSQDCRNVAVGVDSRLKAVPDAQMSSHYAYGDHPASDGRLNAPQGWIGQNTASWLQVDLGNLTEVHAVATQGYTSSSYYTSEYKITYSVDGNSFSYVNNGTSNAAMIFSGSSNVNSITKQTFPSAVNARFIRFVPVHYNTHPGLRVEVYGCPQES